MPERREHPPYLPVSTFVNGHVEDRPVTPYRRHADLRRRRANVVERDAPLQVPNVSLGEPSRNRHAIRLLDAVARMKQRVSQLAIVGQEQRTAGCIIEAPHRHDSRTAGKQIGHGCAPLRIAHRGNDAKRLIQQQIGVAFRKEDGFAVDLNAIALANEGTESRDDLAVNGDAPRRDQLVGTPTRRNSRLREVSIKAHVGAASSFSRPHYFKASGTYESDLSDVTPRKLGPTSEARDGENEEAVQQELGLDGRAPSGSKASRRSKSS
jgi:hypothetical protein